MSGFLTDTLVWTGALLVLVLLVRRPVAQMFGAKAAYALWALPMARLLLPPLVLPAWMAPDPVAPLAAVPLAVEYEAVPPGDRVGLPVAVVAEGPAIDWNLTLLAVWLAGAAVFLVRRYTLYFRMRREFLAAARPAGEVGSIRLVETPEAQGPVAFGVIDKVIALPPGFMASRDIAARDPALAHEIAHHRGRDLLCNMLVQPLFAIHWFNPLAMLGWNALRRDQEAACDARVVADAPREERAAYAAVIARFATRAGAPSRLALAAPMACPVLGDRSIVHRLRTLALNRISRRRRWTGRLLVGAGALALPLTASVSYAQKEAPVAPVPPVPPVAPVPPSAAEAPLPPAAPGEVRREWTSKDGKRRIVPIERLQDGDAKHDDRHRRIERHIVIRDRDDLTAEDRAELREEMEELRKELRKEFGKDGEFQREMEREFGKNGEFEKELNRELRKELGKKGEITREMRISIADARAVAAHARALAPKVSVRCSSGQREVAETITSKDGRQHIYVCTKLATAEARRALSAARVDIERARGLSDADREDALESIEDAEEDIRAENRISHSPIRAGTAGHPLSPAVYLEASARKGDGACDSDGSRRPSAAAVQV